MNSRLIRETLPTDASAPAANDASPSTPGLDLADSRLYIHRELSQLQFNIRVLDQALDESHAAAGAAEVPADLLRATWTSSSRSAWPA